MQKTLLFLMTALTLASCREADGPLGGVNGQLVVSSDPEGGHIYLDDKDTGFLTPDTIAASGSHDVVVILDSLSSRYSYAAHAVIQGIEPFMLSGPLTARCAVGADNAACYSRNRVAATAGNMTLSMNATGAMLLQSGNGGGLVWPANTSDSYVSQAMPLIAAKVSGKAVALGVYDVTSLAGRPAMNITNVGGQLATDQRTWIVPATTSTTLVTIRGIEIREQMIVDPSQPEVALIKITYRNITNSPLYQKVDPRGTALGFDGVSYDDVYLGFGIDADIGTADDDVMTYDPDLHAVITYDSNFSDSKLNIAAANAPGLVGLRMVSVPSGAPIILGGYGSTGTTGDWHASTIDESVGWGVMSGTASYTPDDPDATIGTLVTQNTDVRMLVSAGPYALRPAEELSIIVAVAIAPPVPGTFTPAVTMSSGNPHDPTRPIMATAAAVRKKLTDAALLIGKFGN